MAKSLVTRFVTETTLCRKAYHRREPILPLVVLRAFLPSASDNGVLSFYTVDIDRHIELAAAYWLVAKELPVILAVEQEKFEGAGFEFTATAGQTYHHEINPLHIDVKVSTSEQSLNLAKLFWEQGQMLSVELMDIKKEIASGCAASKIDFVQLAKDKKQNSVARLCELIHGKNLSVTA